jgi:hypothetical protein
VVDSQDSVLVKPPNQLALLIKKTEVKTISIATADNFMNFINAHPIKLEHGITPLKWWYCAEQRSLYPCLSCIVIAILSIPAESSEPERIFSGARRTCSWDRLRLKCITIEMIECIGNWLRLKHIKPFCENGLGLLMGPELVEVAAGLEVEGEDSID